MPNDINKLANIRNITLDHDLFMSASEDTHYMRAKHGDRHRAGADTVTLGYCPRCAWGDGMFLRGWHGVTCSFCGYTE